MKKRVVALLLCLAMVVMAFAACTPATDNKQQDNNQTQDNQKQDDKQDSKEDGNKEEGNNGQDGQTANDTIVYAMNTAPDGVFNPLIYDTMYDEAVNNAVYASLMTINSKGELEPYLAESVEVSDDQLVITYKLRDAKWHDGNPVTAEDVVYTFTMMAAGKNSALATVKGAKAFQEGTADTVEGIKALDEKTVEITFESVYSPALTNLGKTGIIAKHIWGNTDLGAWDDATELLNNPVGCGPYKMVEYKVGEYVKFEAFGDFFLGAPKTANLIYKVVNADTAQAELTAGTANIINASDLQTTDVDTLKGEGYQFASYPSFLYQYMGFNLRDPRFQDVNVRKAFMYGINRQAMVDALLEGRGKLVNAPMLPSLWAYPNESELEQYPYDVEKAKALLADAGWTDANGDGILENAAGENFKVTIDCPTGSPKREQSAVIIQEDLKKLGLEVEVANMDFTAIMEKVVSNHEFELYMMGNTLDLDPDPKPFWHKDAVSHEKGVQGYNIVGYENPVVDKLIEDGLATLDQNERKAAYNEFGKILNNDVAQVYLYNQDIERLFSSNLEGYTPSTFNEFYNIHNWTLK